MENIRIYIYVSFQKKFKKWRTAANRFLRSTSTIPSAKKGVAFGFAGSPCFFGFWQLLRLLFEQETCTLHSVRVSQAAGVIHMQVLPIWQAHNDETARVGKSHGTSHEPFLGYGFFLHSEPQEVHWANDRQDHVDRFAVDTSVGIEAHGRLQAEDVEDIWRY